MEDVKFMVSAAGDGVKFNCEASSGPGRLILSGNLQYGGNGFLGDLSIRADNFLLFSLPEYEIRVSPDARFLYTFEK